MSWILQLAEEHALIRRVVTAVDTMVAVAPCLPAAFASGALELFQGFVEQHHERTEEDGLFPLLRERLGAAAAVPLDALQAEHADGHTRLAAAAAMLREPDADGGTYLAAYAGLLRAHTVREDEMLASILADGLDAADLDRIADAHALTPVARTAMHRLADALELASQAASAGRPAPPSARHARDLMRKRTGAVGPEASLHHALEQMNSLGVRELPVVHGANVVGILAVRDLDPHRGRLEWTPVRAAMTASPVTARPDSGVAEVAHVLRRHGFNALPVVENGALLGMIGCRDLLAAIPDRSFR